jgi:uncharacterized protein YjeT (DUF2065 family)
VILWLLHGNDFRAVLRAVAALGGGLAIVAVIRGIIVAVCSLAWWRLLTALTVVPLHVILVLRMVGEAVNVRYRSRPSEATSYGRGCSALVMFPEDMLSLRLWWICCWRQRRRSYLPCSASRY